MQEPAPRAVSGFIEPALREEFPGLRLDWLIVPVRDRPSAASIRARLRELSTRVRGATVVGMRVHPVPSAYRSFYRQIGLDPDTHLTPSEQAARKRLFYGEFRSEGLVDDALTISLVETNVPVWAIDAEHLGSGRLGVRQSVAGDRLGTSQHANYIEPGRLVVADDHTVHAVLFGEVAREHGITSRTRRAVLFAVGVAGVPAIHIDEALWICIEILQTR